MIVQSARSPIRICCPVFSRRRQANKYIDSVTLYFVKSEDIKLGASFDPGSLVNQPAKVCPITFETMKGTAHSRPPKHYRVPCAKAGGELVTIEALYT